MNRIKVTVERQVTETWEFYIDADKLDIPISSKGLTPGQHGDACDALHGCINGTDDDGLLTDELKESTVNEESIIEWDRA